MDNQLAPCFLEDADSVLNRMEIVVGICHDADHFLFYSKEIKQNKSKILGVIFFPLAWTLGCFHS
jgi:nucleoside permease NupC